MDGSVRFSVNGRPCSTVPAPDKHLLHVLREELGLTGAKPGCGEGECGACTVLLQGRPVRACQVPAAAAAGAEVTTIEGLGASGALHPVQHAFALAGALQCGYCTPGMVLAAAALLAANPDPGPAEIREALDGNICRCGTYPRILEAVRRAAALAGAASPAPAPPPPPPGPIPGRAVPWDLLAPAERDYFAALGDGLVACAGADPGRAGGRHGGAWVHVGADGAVRAFTGKVDVGQDTEAALALLAAAELRLPPAAVTVVGGDTDVCPFDPGTFGSRSMPDAGPRMRAAAAAAREALLDLAAEALGAPRASLAARGGRVAAPDGAAVTYAALVSGLRRVVVAPDGPPPGAPPAPAPAEGPGRKALAAVTGSRRYPTDVALPGMLHGRVLRAPAIGASLRSVDTAAASALPGVRVVREGDFVGVVAPDRLTAARAVEAIRAEWDEPAGPDDAGLEAYLRAHPAPGRPGEWGGPHAEEAGDPDAALASCAIRLTATYTTAFIAHAPLETRAAVAAWEDGRLTVFTGTQQPFRVRQDLASAFGLPEARVRVIVPPTGSGFGGRHNGAAALEAARLSRAAGRPVKVAWSRQEEFTCGYFRPAAVIDVEAGLDASGRLQAWTFRNLNAGTPGLPTPYSVPARRHEFQPCRSPLPQGSYRALAATANNFAREAAMDELAALAGEDPLAFRLRHLEDGRLAAVLRAAADRFGWEGRARAPGRGAGIAAGREKGGRIATAVEVEAGPGGSVRLLRLVAAFECGRIVNPDGLQNQVQGALVQGLGGALFEAVRFRGGRIANPAFSRYRVPRLRDVPPLEVVLLDVPDEAPAGGGETPIIAVAPALAGAIWEATGRRLRALPLLPEEAVAAGDGAH